MVCAQGGKGRGSCRAGLVQDTGAPWTWAGAGQGDAGAGAGQGDAGAGAGQGDAEDVYADLVLDEL